MITDVPVGIATDVHVGITDVPVGIVMDASIYRNNIDAMNDVLLAQRLHGVPVVTGGAMVTNNVPVSTNLPVVVKVLRLIAVTSC